MTESKEAGSGGYAPNDYYSGIDPTTRRTISSYEVFRWPEFQVLCKRLGVPLGLHVRDVTIALQLEPDDVVKVTMNFLGTVDRSEPIPPNVSYVTVPGNREVLKEAIGSNQEPIKDAEEATKIHKAKYAQALNHVAREELGKIRNS